MQTCYRHGDRKAGVICQRCDRPICPSCMHQASVGFHCPECTKSGAQKVIKASQLVTRPVVTYALIAINLVIYIACVGSGLADAPERGRSTTASSVRASCTLGRRSASRPASTTGW